MSAGGDDTNVHAPKVELPVPVGPISSVSFSAPFIRRPVATTLLTIALALAGIVAYSFLPVSPLPQVDSPTISVGASLPGASPEIMASAVATPLERQFGRIAGVTEMTSTSSLGSTSISIQFDLNRNVDAAARDVQAAINAARGQLPTNLPNNPTYRKVNPADSPIMLLALTSETYDKGAMYDAASSILAQKIAQIDGVGQVSVGGGSAPAVRVEVNPTSLNHMGLSLEDVRTTLGAANANRPKGSIDGEDQHFLLAASDQIKKARDYEPLIVAYRDGAPVRVGDVATVADSVEDIHALGITDGKPSILIVIFRQPGANIIDTVDRIQGMMKQLQAEIPQGMRLGVTLDRSKSIRGSVRDVEMSLAMSIGLVILVVFIFLRDIRTTLIPSVAVPISLIGTFGAMYLLNYSLDNLSLMALTIATGFVVDDAIVVIENITRHLEKGMRPIPAALLGAKEIGFTVVSISVSLIAVFIPILLMGGYIGRLFREFAVTLSIAIAVSLVVSLTTTPMMCAMLLRPKEEERRGRLYRASEAVFDFILRLYERSLGFVLRHPFATLLVTLGTIGFTAYLYTVIPKGLFPQQDTGRLQGSIEADQDVSFQAMSSLVNQIVKVIGDDEGTENVSVFAGGGGGPGGGSSNTARMFIGIKGGASSMAVKARLDGKLRRIPGVFVGLQPTQDIRIGARQASALYQYTLQADDLSELLEWAPKLQNKLRTLSGLTDVNSDQKTKGLQAKLDFDRATAARLGITPAMIDATLYDAFGQRQVSTIYNALNQNHVVMEVDPSFSKDPEALRYVYVRGNNGAQIPLSTFARYTPGTTSLAVNHQGQFPAITISFNLAPGHALGDAVTEIQQAEREIGVPASIHGTFQGTAQAFEAARANQLLLILAALVTVYIVLGVLYESYIHPITILSTLPSAGVGALLALMICHEDLGVIGLIGIILLIGIVKKNAIMMIDFALEAERSHGRSPRDAIFEACILRFRPITMTTMAALLGGLPLALGTGMGSELRRPLGIAIVGGLIFSQALTLYTTPVVYLYLDRLRLWIAGDRRVEHGSGAPTVSHPATA